MKKVMTKVYTSLAYFLLNIIIITLLKYLLETNVMGRCVSFLIDNVAYKTNVRIFYTIFFRLLNNMVYGIIGTILQVQGYLYR
jgi:mannitol-specific phosphotransferase system IIBC component